MNDERTQVADQCKVIIGLAKIIIEVHTDLEDCFRNSEAHDSLTKSIGKHTAQRMETLGDMINGMDAVEPEDDWMVPFFEKAHKMWKDSK